MKELTFKLVNRFLSFICLFLITFKKYARFSIEYRVPRAALLYCRSGCESFLSRVKASSYYWRRSYDIDRPGLGPHLQAHNVFITSAK